MRMDYHLFILFMNQEVFLPAVLLTDGI